MIPHCSYKKNLEEAQKQFESYAILFMGPGLSLVLFKILKYFKCVL